MRFSYKTILLATAFITQAVYGGEPASVRPAAKLPSRIELAQAPDAETRAALPDLLARAEALSRSGKAAEAYDLLLSAEDSYIGTIEFDYALGRQSRYLCDL